VADTRLAEINQVAATTGDDPELPNERLLRYRDGPPVTYLQIGAPLRIYQLKSPVEV
jgi:hypothetical protein